MLFEKNRKKWYASSLALMAMGTLALVSAGCSGGGDSYDTPTVVEASAAATSRLLSVEDLKAIVDAGKVNGGGYDNVVILHVNSSATAYNAGHIPGAQFLASGLIYQTRVEGPSSMTSMVANGPQMDILLQSLGIDENTTIVLTGASTTYPARAYFTLRYWGFAKNCIYMLDGLDTAWTEANYDLETESPTVAPSTFSVKDNGGLNDDLRASLGEMIVVAEAEAVTGAASDVLQNGNPDTIILDNRSVTQLAATSYAYNGRWNGAVQMSTSSGGGIVGSSGKSWGDEAATSTSIAEELETYITSLGATQDMKIYVHCTSGTAAANAFFALDGILGWDVVLYDGSWGQMRILAPTDKGGDLPAGSVWAPKVGSESARMSVFAWGYDLAADPTTFSAPAMNLIDAATLSTMTTASDPRGNQIENEDAEYMLQSSGDSGSDSLVSGGGGGC